MFEREVDGSVHVLRLAHGKVSAMDLELVDGLVGEMEELAGRAGAVVITGSGTTFSAGVDLRRVVTGGAEYVERFIPALGAMFEAVFTAPLPVVAAVNGWAVAGGCVLAAACDRRILAAGARIGATELRVGVPFPVSALEVLRHACGGHTDEVVLGADLHAGADAVRLGLAHEVVEDSALMSRGVAVAATLAAMPAGTYRRTKDELRAPARDRMAADRAPLDAEVIAAWSAPSTLDALGKHLERLRREASP